MRLASWIAVAIVVCIVPEARAATSGAGDPFSPEAMLFENIPVIFSATRSERSAADVPNAVTVLTQEDIRDSGATNLTELLELVPGIDIARTSRSDVNLSARGFNSSNNSNMLVMLDGRSVYQDFFGNVQWDRINVALSDIERIEVVRGPASALYGANALLGTINIVTRLPESQPPLQVWSAFGSRGGFTEATAARSWGPWAVKGSGRWEARDHFRNNSRFDPSLRHKRGDTGLRAQRLSGTVQRALRGGGHLRLTGGISKLRGETHTVVGNFAFHGPEYHLQAELERGLWRMRGFLTYLDMPVSTVPASLPVPGVPLSDRIRSDILDLEVQREVRLGGQQLILGGSTRRLVTNAASILGTREADQFYAAFVQDQIRLGDRVTAFLAARVDQQQKIGLNFSPRVSLLIKPTETTRAWLAFSRAFRAPTQVLQYLSLPLSGFTPSPTQLLRIDGEPGLNPSWVTSWEGGFRLQPLRHTSVTGQVFYEVLSDIAELFTVSAGPPVQQSFRNAGRMRTWGGELALELRPWDGITGFASYSFQQAAGRFEGISPKNKLSLGVRGHRGRLRFSLDGVYVARTTDEITGSGAGYPTLIIPSRFQVNGFLGVQVQEHLELGVRARNIFHQVREQFPVGDDIGSEVLATARVSF
ncbi:MAG: TonB-dependent receptor plug domain-containing protein [Myxococcota bacterium]